MYITSIVTNWQVHREKLTTQLNSKGQIWGYACGSPYGVQNFDHKNSLANFSYGDEPQSIIFSRTLWQFRHSDSNLDRWTCSETAQAKFNNPLVCDLRWASWCSMGWKLKHSTWWFKDAVPLKRWADKAEWEDANPIWSERLEPSLTCDSESLRDGLGFWVGSWLVRAHYLFFWAKKGHFKLRKAATSDKHSENKFQKRLSECQEIHERSCQT